MGGENVKDLAPGYSYYERDEQGKLTACIKEMTLIPLLAMAGNVSKREMKRGILKGKVVYENTCRKL